MLRIGDKKIINCIPKIVVETKELDLLLHLWGSYHFRSQFSSHQLVQLHVFVVMFQK